MLNGRPYASTSSDLDTLPLSAIERIELLSGESLGTLGGSAVRGALNVVLRNDLDGFETRALARLPTRSGGDGWQGSAFWGGAVGNARMTLGVDVLRREEIASQNREYSRSVWPEGGAFNQAQNVSVGGNTVWVVQRDVDEDEELKVTGVRSVALGECDPAKGYTGPLGNPPGIRSGDKGCGFAYGAIAWNTSRYEQRSAVLNLDLPLTENADLHLDANFTQGDSAFRYAPSVNSFSFELDPTRTERLLQAINDAAGSDFEADGNDRFVVAHRFVRHGNRDWLTDTEEYDVSGGPRGPDSGGCRLRCAHQRLPAGRFRVRPHLRARRQDCVGDPGRELRPRKPVLGRPGSFARHREHQPAAGERFRREIPGSPAGAGGGRIRERRPQCGMDGRVRAGACKGA